MSQRMSTQIKDRYEKKKESKRGGGGGGERVLQIIDGRGWGLGREFVCGWLVV